MNSAEDRPSTANCSAIDRLVDGELSDAERRELLIRLENDPDGWRRCALAFLEDQAWRSAIAGRAVGVSKAGPSPASASRSPRRRPSLRRLSAVATVLAATFAAGLAVGGMSRDRGSVGVAPPPVVAKNQPTPPPAPEPIREVGWVNVVDQSSGESPSRRVPILSGPGLDDRWLSQQPSSVPDYVRTLWERQGYQVEERRRLVSVQLEDGRRVSIPVDEVALEYVGQKTF
jgi:anti-sigma factor RsiW